MAAFPAIAAELPASAKLEVDGLLQSLGSSSCEFYRNGTWYGAAQARAHLQKKYEYLLDRGMIGSTEEFISAAATQSSRSGEAYQVRCPSQPAEPSAAWLKRALAKQRGSDQP